MSAPDLASVAAWAIEALVASTLLMLAVLALRRPVRRAFGPDIAYALWALPALRLVLPPLPASWHAAVAAPVLRATEQVTVLFVDAGAEPVAASTPWATMLANLKPALAVVWLAGAGAFALWHAFAHRRFCARTLAQAVERDTVRGVRVIESAAVSGPLAFGVWRRYVAFPRDLAERYDAEERDLALAHELGHHARGDLIANWMALFVLALHWFNPIAWRAFRAFRADQEIANDARVLAGLGPMRRHAYACAIVKTAHPATFGAVSTACHLNTIDDLKGRLRMLTINRVSRLRRFAGAATVTLLIGGGLGLTASGTLAAAAARDTVEHAAGVELAAIDQASPEPPAPPMPRVADAVPLAPARPPVIGGNAAPGDRRKVVRVITVPSGAATYAERAAFRDGKDVTKHRMILMTGMGDTAQRIEVLNVPEVSESKCGVSSGKPSVMVIEGKSGERRKMIVCTDRIEKAGEAAAMAANGKDIERDAYASALASLRRARARMTDSTDLSGDQRKAALDGMDTAIRELEGDLAKAR